MAYPPFNRSKKTPSKLMIHEFVTINEISLSPATFHSIRLERRPLPTWHVDTMASARSSQLWMSFHKKIGLVLKHSKTISASVLLKKMSSVISSDKFESNTVLDKMGVITIDLFFDYNIQLNWYSNGALIPLRSATFLKRSGSAIK